MLVPWRYVGLWTVFVFHIMFRDSTYWLVFSSSIHEHISRVLVIFSKTLLLSPHDVNVLLGI